MTDTDITTTSTGSRPHASRVAVLGVGLVWLAAFVLLGSNGVAYALTLLGLPVAAGALWGRRTIPVWWVLGGLAVFGVVDWVVGDKARAGDLPFFVVVTLAQFGIAALARWLTAAAARRRARR